MSEVLWDTVVRAVDGLEKKTNGLQDQVNGLPDHSEFLRNINGRLGAAEAEIKDLPRKIFMPLPEILALTNALQTHSQLLSMPLKKEVRHEHHLSKPVWACIVMFLIIIGLLFLEFYTWFEADQRKENDIKYRSIKAFASPKDRKSLDRLDSAYNSNPEQFTKAVLQQEKIELDSSQDFRRAQENQQEINNIHEKWNRQPGRKSN